ncbi:MAG: hypothetical protein AAGJ09_08210 [Pseudomonadota bacterium]
MLVFRALEERTPRQPGQICMHSDAFIQDITLVDLGGGAGICIWGFRASAQGKSNCACVEKGFQRSLGDDATATLNAIRTFAAALGQCGRRKVGLATPGHVHITRDEASILAAVSAAQVDDMDAAGAHLAWLLAGPTPEVLLATVRDIGKAFARHDMMVVSPDYIQTKSKPLRPKGAPKLSLVATA